MVKLKTQYVFLLFSAHWRVLAKSIEKSIKMFHFLHRFATKMINLIGIRNYRSILFFFFFSLNILLPYEIFPGEALCVKPMFIITDWKFHFVFINQLTLSTSDYVKANSENGHIHPIPRRYFLSIFPEK